MFFPISFAVVVWTFSTCFYTPILFYCDICDYISLLSTIVAGRGYNVNFKKELAKICQEKQSIEYK